MKTVFIVMLRDVCDDGETIINECVPFSTKSKAQQHLKAMVDNYKEEIINEFVGNDEVGYDTDTEKDYVMLESEDSLSFYRQGYYNNNHIEIWIEEKEIDTEDK